HVIDRLRILAIMLFNGLQLTLNIIDICVDLSAANPGIQGLDQFGERFVFHRKEFQDEQKGDEARIRVPVITKVEMTGMFAPENSILLAHLCLNKGMPYTRANGLAALSFNQCRDALRKDQVV